MTDRDLSAGIVALVRYDELWPDALRDAPVYYLVRDYLESLEPDVLRRTLGRMLREQYLSEAALARGQGLAEVIAVVDWLDREMGIRVGR